MLDLATLQRYDLSKMYEVYDKWPQLAREAYYSNDFKISTFKKVDHVIFAGMGGSGAIGDVFSSILSNSSIHVNVVKGFTLPKTVGPNTLVVCISVSGNTMETLTVLKSARENNCKIISFASGGKMEQYCIKNNIDFVKIKEYNSPRASFAVLLFSMLKVLKSIIKVDFDIVDEVLLKIENLGKRINSSNLSDTNNSLQLASWINQVPVIYYPGGLKSVAIRFKNSLQENSKIHAIIEEVVEAGHNGIVSWESPSNFQPILLRGKNDYFKTIELWDILKEYFSGKKIDFFEITSPEGHILSKLVCLTYLLDYATIYHAVLRKIDPSPVKSINFVKSRINSRF